MPRNSTHPVRTPITGSPTGWDGNSPSHALAQFYAAFNGRNLRLMSENRLQSPETAMDNPLGGIVRGWEAIMAVYERIFNGPAIIYGDFFDYTMIG